MDYTVKIENYRKEINEALSGLFTAQEPESLYEPMRYAVNIGGKRIRPILCGIFYRMFKGKKKKVLYPALAVELLHNFTLVHDDIMDDDDLRRNQQTVHVKWDLSTGVLSGDGIVSLAYRVLIKEKFKNSDKIIKVFTDGLLEVCEGQAYDKEFETREDVSEKEYISMINNKTAALLAVPSRIGALCAEAPDSLVVLAEKYGRALGLAFQIQDDLLDIAGDEALFGKTYGSDVSEGKKTYLYILARKLMSEKDLKTFDSIAGNENASRSDLIKVKKLYEKYGIIQKAEDEAAKYIKQAEKIIRSVPAEYDTSELIEFTKWMLKRKY
ncbi:MAG TPA: polyprenyl synthetase family protein [Clostridiales bacterium]|jgi:geranylgeranyl diphosphate synthase, type II|nr:polyprenyl synthetase family protein [Clostridiales bacterium]HQP69274.1 polyprenyl synthetase family protein [Clostridiales bacterium]